MFDLDGTLVDSTNIDSECYLQALVDVFGFDLDKIDRDWGNYPHITDAGILQTLCQTELDRNPTSLEIQSYQQRFLDLLNLAVTNQPLQEIIGAKNFLQHLVNAPNYAIAIATGAWRKTAEFKLQQTGLDRIFLPNIEDFKSPPLSKLFLEWGLNFRDRKPTRQGKPQDRTFRCQLSTVNYLPIACSDDDRSRVEIMRCAYQRSIELYQQSQFETVTYIGDGVWDGVASAHLAYHFIGIGSGDRVKDLLATGAKQVFPNYQNISKIMSEIEQF